MIHINVYLNLAGATLKMWKEIRKKSIGIIYFIESNKTASQHAINIQIISEMFYIFMQQISEIWVHFTLTVTC